jgi:predicted DNA-binding transcriptional regulator AlpA
VIHDEIRTALQERERDTYLNNRQAAAYTGRSLAAWGVYIRRHPDLRKMAIGSSRSRRWRRSDLDAWFRAGEHA